MSDECDLCLLRLFFLSSLLLTGSSEGKDDHVFIRSGVNGLLPCNNHLQDCSSTTWISNTIRDSAAVEVIAGGKIRTDVEGHERLSLGSNCSLNINNITEDDSGHYTCQQWTGPKEQKQQQQGSNAGVYLHVLRGSSSSSSSSSQTEISADSVTLSCQLYSYPGGSCDWISSQGIELLLVNQTDVKLKRSDSRYQRSSGHCLISLNTTLLNEDLNRDWRCEVTHGGQVKSSVTFTVERSASDSPGPPGTTSVAVIGIAVVLLIPALSLWLIRRKRAGVRRAPDDSVLTDRNKQNVNTSVPPAVTDLHDSSSEQTDDVTYTEVTAYCKHKNKKNKVHCDDKVTYASIGGAEAGDQDNCRQLYASVNKNHHKSHT